MHTNSTTSDVIQVVDFGPVNHDSSLSDSGCQATCPSCGKNSRMRRYCPETAFPGDFWRELLQDRYACNHCEHRVEYLSPIVVGMAGLAAVFAAILTIGWLIF